MAKNGKKQEDDGTLALAGLAGFGVLFAYLLFKKRPDTPTPDPYPDPDPSILAEIVSFKIT